MLYRIENLECAYKNGPVVLKVPFLELQAGQTIVVLGKSGYGKSTFLETLALMNNTFSKGKLVFSPPSMNGQDPMDLTRVWFDSEKEHISGIRNRHFSFIFQQTNLMPNFTVYENIYVTRLLQGFSEKDCLKETRELLKRIGLSESDALRKVTELSGGQRQRVAFARAIISSYDVLFGDEPTGNLDEYNSRELMQLLAEQIREQKEGFPKTALIVSHNIEMAMEFADSILVISWNPQVKGGEIREQDVFHKTQSNQGSIWKNKDQQFSEGEFIKHLRNIF